MLKGILKMAIMLTYT